MGGWVYELKIRLNSASVGVELKLKLKLSLAIINFFGTVVLDLIVSPVCQRCLTSVSPVFYQCFTSFLTKF